MTIITNDPKSKTCPEPVFINGQTAASMLAISPRTLKRLVANREIPKYKIGALCRYRPEDLRRFAENKLTA